MELGASAITAEGCWSNSEDYDMTTRVIVNPGVCGFTTTITTNKQPKRRVAISITSDCKLVSLLADSLKETGAFEIMKPMQECEVFEKASKCPLHLTCLVPIGILKAIEAEAELALPRDAGIHFDNPI
jgi:hypothetical protein